MDFGAFWISASLIFALHNDARSTDGHQFSDARDGLTFAICFTVAWSSSALNDGNEQIRLLQANAAGSPRSGYSTSGLGNLPSRRSNHSIRLYLAAKARADACKARARGSSLWPTMVMCTGSIANSSSARRTPGSGRSISTDALVR